MGAEVDSFRGLQVWQEAMLLAVDCYRITSPFPKSETFGLTSQIRSAAVSIYANVAEGSGRRTTTDFIRFVDMATGSIRELESHFELARRLTYLDSDPELDDRLDKVGRMLTKLRQSSKAKLQPI
jgi:four helix bundle protein